jgi:NAD(P)-dependent dehydrogenase (short-subunit alcohol dehydrogenase family)
MVDVPAPHRLSVSGESAGIAAAIGERLIARGACIPAEGQVTAALVDGCDRAGDTPFLELTDAQFGEQVIVTTLDRVAALQAALGVEPNLRIVIVGTVAHLGGWNGVGQGAASAALIGIMRSVAMEYGRQGTRVNLIALPLGASRDDEALIEDAVTQAAALFASESITGQTIVIDRGENLYFRQARRR